ncbi:hypothetical protein TNCV_864561 [Trichonephila clavipes]|nr:hypothetical protein TNCV_864561 [Trichonephila clavipes]
MAGVVVLGERGHVLVLRYCAHKTMGGMRRKAGVVVLVKEVMCWFSGPAPQNNVGGMREGSGNMGRWK